MAPTILIVGATGNTGRSVVETLPGLLQNTKLSSYRILALTRSKESAAAKKLAEISGVEVAEKNWTEIDDEWLRQYEVERLFIASHNDVSHFAEESQFHYFALQAGVKYAVRISTTAYSVKPDCPAFYPRAHWAIESLLGQPEYQNYHWSSLQPNVFTTQVLAPALDFITEHRKTGKQGPLSLILDRDSPNAMIDAYDVGVFAAHLLAFEETSRHNKAKYVLTGPEDVTGEEVVKLVDGHIGEPVKDVKYKDFAVVDAWAESMPEQRTLIKAIGRAGGAIWGGSALETRSKEVPEIYTPSRTTEQVLKEMVEGIESAN